MMSLPAHDADAATNGFTLQKSNVVSPFDHFHLAKGMVPFMTLFESCDTETSNNGLTWPKIMLCIVSIVLI